MLSPFKKSLPPDTFEGGYTKPLQSSVLCSGFRSGRNTGLPLRGSNNANGSIELNTMTPGVM